jgi:excisionase family DNA binding protein
MLQVSPATIYRWVLSGEIEHLRFPGKQGHHRITRSALERFAAAHGIPMLEPGNGNGAQLKPPKTKKAKKQIRPAA